jgi:hypothetical protein
VEKDMKERLKRPQLYIITGIIKLIVLFAVITIVSVVASSFNNPYYSVFIEYAAFVLFAVLCFLVITRLLTEYSYSVAEDRFIIEKYIFSRPRLLMCVKFSDVSYIGRYLPRNFTGRKLTATYKKNGVVFIVYGSGGIKKCAILSPSKRMLDLITTGKENSQ